MKSLRLLVAAFFITGCSAIPGVDPVKIKSPPLYNYKADMQIWIDGSGPYDGFALAQLKPKQKISIVSKAKLSVLNITTCQRDSVIEKADKNWFGGVGKEYAFNYEPTPREQREICPIYIKAFDSDGVSAWGYIAFNTDDAQLPATLTCNSVVKSYAGLSLCQSRAGLPQDLVFQLNVEFVKSDGCMVETTDNKSFGVRATQDFCYMTFKADGKLHRLILFGYKDVYVRGD